jgi:hypothetical protein
MHVPGRLAAAWRDTPTKWYPLPFGVGALLLVALQARKEWLKAEKDREHEVHVNDQGREVMRLKGAWQVCDVPVARMYAILRACAGTCAWRAATPEPVQVMGLVERIGITSVVPAHRLQALCRYLRM